MNIVNPREVWQREEEDFSSWLVKSLDLLDEVLDTKLELITREKPVGPFFADILCFDKKDDNSLVVIENQLEQSDHDHLGKLLTYAAGLQATTVIWIATAFENEHRNALAWLNSKTNNRIRSFGVKLELEPIDFSKCLPKFTLFAGPRVTHQPNANNKNQQQAANPPPKVESPYWSAFRKFWGIPQNELVPYKPEENKNRNYFGVNSGSHIGCGKRFWFAAWRNNMGTEIAAKLFMRSEKDFDALKAQQRDIVSENCRLNTPLEWDRHPDYAPGTPQVGFYKRELPRNNKAAWQNQFKWLLTAFEDLERIFGERIETLVSPIRDPSETDDIPF